MTLGVQSSADVDVTLHDAGKKCRGSDWLLNGGLSWNNTSTQRNRYVSPHRVTSLWWSSNHDRARSQRRRHLRHALTGPLEHGRSTSRHDIGVQNFADVNATLRQGRNVVESAGLFAGESWLEQHLRATDTFSADSGVV